MCECAQFLNCCLICALWISDLNLFSLENECTTPRVVNFILCSFICSQKGHVFLRCFYWQLVVDMFIFISPVIAVSLLLIRLCAVVWVVVFCAPFCVYACRVSLRLFCAQYSHLDLKFFQTEITRFLSAPRLFDFCLPPFLLRFTTKFIILREIMSHVNYCGDCTQSCGMLWQYKNTCEFNNNKNRTIFFFGVVVVAVVHVNFLLTRTMKLMTMAKPKFQWFTFIGSQLCVYFDHK